MFRPLDHALERGWVGRIDGDLVIHLAAQTLQSFFTGGGAAREHAVYSLAGVRLLAPVLHPPSVRIFDDEQSFAFANPAAIVGPWAHVTLGVGETRSDLTVVPRLAAVIGRDGALAGFTGFVEWRAPGRVRPKDRDFALGLGPVVVTSDEFDPRRLDAVVRVGGAERLRAAFPAFDWPTARDLAAEATRLLPGDVIAGPSPGEVSEVASGASVELAIDAGIGMLAGRVERSSQTRQPSEL